jgi:hypothetical protein
MVKRMILVSYKQDKSIKDTSCLYCGSYGESKDHIPAVSIAEDYPDIERIVVRSCTECNSTLCNRTLLTIKDRAEFLHKKYNKKYQKIMSLPEWTRDEIDDLYGMLKRKIILAVKRKKNSIRRLANIERLIEKEQMEEI